MTAAPRLFDIPLERDDASLADAAIDLIRHGEFADALALLRCRVEEGERERRADTVRRYLVWYDLPAATRPPFWEWTRTAQHPSSRAFERFRARVERQAAELEKG